MCGQTLSQGYQFVCKVGARQVKGEFKVRKEKPQMQLSKKSFPHPKHPLAWDCEFM